MDDLRFPIGKYQPKDGPTAAEISAWIDEIAAAPSQIRAAVAGLSDAQLDTPYRPGGWTVRQVVHHVPDSHINSYVRFRLALTEEDPLIKTYEEARWAELPDARSEPLDSSLALLDSLHQRWVVLLRSLSPADLQRTFRHPELGKVTLSRTIGLYAWHGRHHVAHITGLRARNGWA